MKKMFVFSCALVLYIVGYAQGTRNTNQNRNRVQQRNNVQNKSVQQNKIKADKIREVYKEYISKKLELFEKYPYDDFGVGFFGTRVSSTLEDAKKSADRDIDNVVGGGSAFYTDVFFEDNEPLAKPQVGGE